MCSKGKNEENEKKAHGVRIFDMCVHMYMCAYAQMCVCMQVPCVCACICAQMCVLVCVMDSNREFSKEEMRMTRNVLQSVPYH